MEVALRWKPSVGPRTPVTESQLGQHSHGALPSADAAACRSAPHDAAAVSSKTAGTRRAAMLTVGELLRTARCLLKADGSNGHCMRA
eukprot:6192223-Pleurochrysis_carterae.AAC.3